MPATSTPVEPLIAHPREQYLRREETRIRSLASNALASGNPDPQITKWLNAVIYAEDLHEIHDVAKTKFEKTGPAHWVEMHVRFTAEALQLKLVALDQLAHLLI